ncbi:hypothetical protein HK096_009740 [Nowakowskiella sp. JEL0078]|nr:hypothetical protein HK096_009740 [Nowakowskiella sp. JEL0078]
MKDVIQTILVCTWLVEIFIQKLNVLKDDVDSASASLAAAKLSNDVLYEELDELNSKLRRLKEEELLVQDEFREFLKLFKVQAINMLDEY